MGSEFKSAVIRRDSNYTYQLPNTPNFADRHTLGLGKISVYAEARQRVLDMGSLLDRTLRAPLTTTGKFFYSPGGADIVEGAREDRDVDMANAKWLRAAILSPGTAVLGLGTVDRDEDGVLMAGAAGPIMMGKSAYFLWTAGVNAEPITVETPLTAAHVKSLIEITARAIPGFFDLPWTRKIKDDLISHVVNNVVGGFLMEHLSGIGLHEEVAFPEDVKNEVLNSMVGQTNAFFTYHDIRGKLPLNDGEKAALKRYLSEKLNKLQQILEAKIFSQAVRKVENNYGFINIEDARGADLPIIFGTQILIDENAGVMVQEVVPTLESQRAKKSAKWSDDKQGTGVITAASLLSWADLTGRMKGQDKPLEGIKVLLMGAGAGAKGVYDEMINLGARPQDILVTDRGEAGPDGKRDSSGTPHAIHVGRQDISDDPFKLVMSQGIPAGTTVEGWLGTGSADPSFRKVDVVINLGDKKTVLQQSWTKNALTRLAATPYVALMTNPDPGWEPGQVHYHRPDAFYASGNQTFENTVNNFTAFGYIGLGTLLARATAVTKEMTVAAAWAIHWIAKLGPPDWLESSLPEEQREYGQHWIVPSPLDTRLIEAQSVAVAAAAIPVSKYFNQEPSPNEREQFLSWLKERAKLIRRRVEKMRLDVEEQAPVFALEEHPERYAPFKRHAYDQSSFYDLVPEVSQTHVVQFSDRLGVSQPRLERFLEENQGLDPRVMTKLLTILRDKSDAGDTWIHEAARLELDLLLKILPINPSLAMALALRRIQSWDTYNQYHLLRRTTVFEKDHVYDVVRDVLYGDLKEITELKGKILEIKSKKNEDPVRVLINLNMNLPELVRHLISKMGFERAIGDMAEVGIDLQKLMKQYGMDSEPQLWAAHNQFAQEGLSSLSTDEVVTAGLPPANSERITDPTIIHSAQGFSGISGNLALQLQPVLQQPDSGILRMVQQKKDPIRSSTLRAGLLNSTIAHHANYSRFGNAARFSSLKARFVLR